MAEKWKLLGGNCSHNQDTYHTIKPATFNQTRAVSNLLRPNHSMLVLLADGFAYLGAQADLGILSWSTGCFDSTCLGWDHMQPVIRIVLGIVKKAFCLLRLLQNFFLRITCELKGLDGI